MVIAVGVGATDIVKTLVEDQSALVLDSEDASKFHASVHSSDRLMDVHDGSFPKGSSSQAVRLICNA